MLLHVLFFSLLIQFIFNYFGRNTRHYTIVWNVMGDNSIWSDSHIVPDCNLSICTAISKKCHIVTNLRYTVIGSPAYAHTRIYAKVFTYYSFTVNYDTSPMEYLNVKTNGCCTKLETQFPSDFSH